MNHIDFILMYHMHAYEATKQWIHRVFAPRLRYLRTTPMQQQDEKHGTIFSTFTASIEQDDPLWKDHLEEAASFDIPIIDEWNTIIDVLPSHVSSFMT